MSGFQYCKILIWKVLKFEINLIKIGGGQITMIF